MTKGDKPTIMIIAGEVSGDIHAARLVRALKSRSPEMEFFGIGGDGMREAGVDTLYDVADMAVMGISEVLRRYSFFKRVFRHMLELADQRKPNAVILVDYPGFNLSFAAKAKAMGLKVIYYICPQVWAWHRSRIPEMARNVDRLITIFPFEKEHFEATGLKVTFAGHPLVESAEESRKKPVQDLPWATERRVALLPGSRPHEIDRILPLMWAASEWLEARHDDLSVIIAAPSEKEAEMISEKLEYLPGGPSRHTTVAGKTHDVLRTARVAMVASGTATVEAALMLCPMIVVYRVSALTFLLGKMLVSIPHIGMVNIIAGKEVCPEFVQGHAVPNAMADACEPLLEDTDQRGDMIKGLEEVRTALGPGGSTEKAADAVLEELGSS